MSFTAENWAWEQDPPSSAAKYVLLCLANYANNEGERAFPSIPTICKRTKLAEKTVRKALAELQNVKLIEGCERFAGKRQLSTEYRLNLREPPLVDLPGGGVVDLPPPPSKSATTPLVNLPGNPSTEYPKNQEVRKDPGASLPREQPDVVRDLFTEGLPILMGLTGFAETRCRGLLGKLRKASGDDCPRVLDALHRACDVRPTDPYPWLLQAVRSDNQPRDNVRPFDPSKLSGAALGRYRIHLEELELQAEEGRRAIA